MTHEALGGSIDRLELTSLQTGDMVRIITGEGEEAFTYDFEVLEPGRWPQGILTETAPSGNVNSSGIFILQGSGRWTTRQENPVQKQSEAFTSYFDAVNLGSFLVGRVPGAKDRLLFDKPRQEISSITLND